MKRLLLLLALLALLCPAPARAQEVEVSGEVIMRVTNAEQAKQITEKIEAHLEASAPADKIRVEKGKGGIIGLYWGDSLLVVVTKELAAANKSEPMALALAWAGKLKKLAELGFLKLTPAHLEMPVNGDASVEVSGAATGEFSVEAGSGRVEITQVDPEHLKVSAKIVGKDKLIIHRGKGKAVLLVHVKDWAGYPPEQVSVRVVGETAPGDMVAEASLRAVSSQTRVNPGCKVDYATPASLPSIPNGQELRFSLAIKIEGNDDYYPVSRSVPVHVTSIKLPPVEPKLLLVSNRPELVDQDGILLEYTLSKKEPSRLMYSHMNGNPDIRTLWVNLTNPDLEPVDVLVNWTYAGPSRNEVLVGHTAAERYLEMLGSGYVLTIPGRRTVELASHELERRELISGFANLRLLEGEHLKVQVLSKLAPGTNNGAPLPLLGAPFNPFKIHPHGVFAQPFFEEWLDYKSGQPPLNLTYGESPWLIDFETGLPNTGNFGVLYHWHVTLSNPTTHPSRLGLAYQTVQGSGAASVLVNGELVQASFRPRGSEGPLKLFELAPKQELTVDIATFPEASSNYPALLQFRELQPGEAFTPEPVDDGRGQGSPSRSGTLERFR